jgi:hypothetical protein
MEYAARRGRNSRIMRREDSFEDILVGGRIIYKWMCETKYEDADRIQRP